MSKKSTLDRAIAELEGERKILDLKIATLRAVQQPSKPSKQSKLRTVEANYRGHADTGDAP